MKRICILLLVLSGFLTLSGKSPGKDQTPESLGISSRAILAFLDSLDRQQPGALHGFVLMRHRKVAAEGWWDPYKPEYPHMLYSLSKSFTSTAVGIAREEGLLSIDDPVLSFFPELAPENPSRNLQAMRVRDLLKMCTGHVEGTMGRIMGQDSWVKAFLDLDVEFKPGIHFLYNTGASFMLAAIVQEVTGQTLLEYLTPRLFDPLGIVHPTWEMNPEGINMGGFGLSIRTEDIARFGQLLLQKGNWNGRQLVARSWVEEATDYQASNGSNPDSDWEQGYGFQFWMCRHGFYRGDGAFGQYCIVMDDLDAVLAINSGTNDMGGIMNIVWEQLLPGMKEEGLPPDPEGLEMLKRKIGALTVGTVQGEGHEPLATLVSGKKYVMEPNVLSISSVTLDMDADPVQVRIMTPDGEKRFGAAYNGWEEGRMKVPLWESDKLWASGAWSAPDTYITRLVYTETPYRVEFQFRFEEDRVYMDTRVNVSFGPTEFDQLTGIAAPAEDQE